MTLQFVDQPAIEFKSVYKSFVQNGKVQPVLSDVSGEIEKSSIVAFVGPSGSGKSTLLALCNMLIASDTGEILIEGKEVRKWDIIELRRKVGIALQTAPVINGTVQENLLITCKLHNRNTYSLEQLTSLTGIAHDLLQRNARSLSGGQRQKLSLARTLSNNSSILLLDEITSALDPISTHEIEELILRLNKVENKTIVLVTHDLEQAKRVADWVWLIINGKVVEKASVQDFFSSPKQEITKQFLMGEK